MSEEAVSIGANTYQYFSRNPQGRGVRPFDAADADAMIKYNEENGIGAILTHAPYILNPSAATEELRQATLEIMREDVGRLEYFNEAMYNFHPGAHVKQGVEAGVQYIADLLNHLIDPGQKTIVLLETMAGKGTEIGRSFEEIRAIMDLVEPSKRDRLGVCMDTCHVSDGGYDIKNSLNDVISEFDRIIGIDRLHAVHLNDSKNEIGAHKDRHEKIGEGYLGLETFRAVINHPALSHLPFFLETPQDLEGYAKEIALLKSIYQG